jgi:PTS system fructose-specific IIC component
MQYLQNIATALMDSNFTQLVLNSKNEKDIINAIDEAIANKKAVPVGATETNTTTNSKGLIIGVSSCATGVAHTYMAREALEKHGKDVERDVWIETQGQSGQEHKLTPELIEKAEAVVIASDINVELDRFIGKKIYKTNTNEAINSPVQTLKKTINSTTIQQNSDGGLSFGNNKKGGFMNHFLNGVSHMIPFIVFSGIVYAILNAISAGVYKGGDIPDGSALYYALQAANIGFSLFTGVMGGYIAMSIAGRAALAPGFIATVCASSPSMYIF